MAPSGAPAMALATAWRMAHVVKTLVERPTHVAKVKGLRRKLDGRRLLATTHGGTRPPGGEAHAAAMVNPPHRFSLRGDVNSADAPASPESAILTSAWALTRSTAM